MDCSACAHFQEISNPNKKENSHFCLLCGMFMAAPRESCQFFKEKK